MKLFFHFSVSGFSNTYLVGKEDKGDAVIIDPGVMNVPLLNMIEGNNYYVRSIFVTHSHDSHVHGIRTLRKIYDAHIYANVPRIQGFDCIPVADGVELEVSGFKVRTLLLPGHSSDSVAYLFDETLLFTGDALAAGRLGSTPDARAGTLLKKAVRDRILSLQGEYLVFPGHGPPTTLMVEKETSPAFRS